MAIEDKEAVKGILAPIKKPTKVWGFQECIDAKATKGVNERREFRSGEHDDLIKSWLDKTGSIGVSGHTPLDVIQRLHDLPLTCAESFCMTVYPGDGVTEWDTWTKQHDDRVGAYQSCENWRNKLFRCKRIFINIEVANRVPGNPERSAVMTLFLTKIIRAIRDASPGCEVVVYNEGMYYGQSLAWHLPKERFGDYRCISGYPDEVGIQRDFVESANWQEGAKQRPYILCLGFNGTYWRPRYFEGEKRWMPKVKLAWDGDHAASLRYFQDIGVMVRNDRHCGGVLGVRPDLFSVEHAERWAAFCEGVADV